MTDQSIPPTIILGLGDFGESCLSSPVQRRPGADGLRSAVLKGAAVSRGMSFRTLDSLTRIDFPGGEGTRQSANENLRANSGSLIEWIEAQVESLVGASEGGDGRIRVFVVAKAEDPDASAVAVVLPELIRARMDGFIASWPISLSAFFLLPKGAAERGEQVFSMLEELRDGRPGYDQIFVVSGSNIGSLLEEEAAGELIMGFVDLMTEPRFEAVVAEIMDLSGADTAGFGLTGIVNPVELLADREVSRFGSELIKGGLLAGAGDTFQLTADEYLRAEGFTISGLKERLLVDGEGDLRERTIGGGAELSGLPLSLWADRIASYADYLGQDKVSRLIGRIEANLDALNREHTIALAAKLDDLMAESAALDKTESFVGRLDEKAAELREAAAAKAKADEEEPEDLAVFHEHLVERLKTFPSPLATAARAALLAPLIYFFFRDFSTVLAGFPDRYINPDYVPSPGVAGFAALMFTVTFLFFLYRRSESGLTRAVDLYMRAIEVKYRSALAKEAWTLLDRWLGRDWPDIIAAERENLRRVRKIYLKLAQGAASQAPVKIGSGVSRSVQEVFGVESDLRYKRGSYELQEEAERFASTHHRDWRTAGQADIDSALKTFCRRGLTYADQRSVDKLILERLPGAEQSAAFLDEMRRRSRPFTTLAADFPAVVEMAGIPGGRRSPLVIRTDLLRGAAVVETADPHKLAFAQLVCPVRFEELAAYAQWRTAYERCPDKTGLACPAGEAS